MIGDSPAMSRLRTLCQVASQHTCNVLINGESGTGKEVAARAIHSGGPRAAGPFVAVDCTSLRDTLLESQLFGHVKGAFTGADHATIGFFRAANGGTLFLDEIGELDLPIQARLLRCIQEHAVVPLGGVTPIPVDVRLLAATHRDLKAMVRAGTFREDLYYRLDVLRLVVPPLRHRGPDTVALADHFLARLCQDHAQPHRRLSEDAAAAIGAYDWPGNVRELANAIEHAFVVSSAPVLGADVLPEHICPRAAPGGDEPITSLAASEARLIERALRATRGNQARAAAMLDIDRRRLYRKIRTYHLEALTRA
jgi:transcriptional regulator with PAS, ATPase and Fis domain